MMRGKWPLTGILLLGSAMIWPTSADAHLVNTGFGSFYDGVVHLALTVEDLLMVLGLALYAGMCGATTARSLVWGLPLAWLGGGLLGMALPSWGEFPFTSVISFMVVGGLVAADLQLPRMAVLALGSVAGLLHGYANGTTMAQRYHGGLALMGTVTEVFIAMALVSALVISRRTEWERIVVRVGGSWIAAIGMLMLGWMARG
jgi:urease accessory protein